MGSKKKIIFSRHAQERMELRKVSEEEVKDTILHPTHKLPINQEDNTQELRRKVGDKENYVVIELRKNELIVITTGWTQCLRK